MTHQSPLFVPKLLLTLINSGRWQQPSEALLAQVVPFISDDFEFLLTEDRIWSESKGSFASMADDRSLAASFYLYRGSTAEKRPLPWLDVETALLIAVNREIGADVGIALDFRSPDIENPRVVASAWVNDGKRDVAPWREVSASLSDFVQRLKL